MPELSLANIDQISRDVRSQEIIFSHLPDDLIDHICCDIEDEMGTGLPFTEAYRKVRQKMGSGRRLKEIQEETLYAVDLKYRKMKNTMKISGITGTVLFGFASLLKIMHWPMAGALLTLGALVLAFVFMPSALSVLWKETHSSKRLFLFVSAFFAALFFIGGILFKVQHWPGAGLVLTLAGISGILFFIPSLLYSRLRDPENKPKRFVFVLGAIGSMLYLAGLISRIQQWQLAGVLMLTGLVTLFVIVFPWYTLITWKNENFIKSEFIFLVVGSLALILPGSLTVLNAERRYDNGYYINLDQQKALYGYLHDKNFAFMEKYRDSAEYKTLQQLHEKSAGMIGLLSKAESELISVSETREGKLAGNAAQVAQRGVVQELNYETLANPFDLNAVQNLLYPGKRVRSEIEAALAGYKTYLAGIITADELAKLESLLVPSAFLPAPTGENRNISMISGLHSLALLKNSVLSAENSAMRDLVSKN
jgi:hypothetical protein